MSFFCNCSVLLAFSCQFSAIFLFLIAADESGQAMTDEELWEDVHDVMGAGAGVLYNML
jgi:hypothetical protein